MESCWDLIQGIYVAEMSDLQNNLSVLLPNGMRITSFRKTNRYNTEGELTHTDYLDKTGKTIARIYND